jgi:hypothetical protein
VKTLEDIRRQKAVHIRMADPQDGCMGFVEVGKSCLKFIASWGGGWDHISVSREDRTPRWEEMSAVRDLFFKPEECVLQYHPPHDRYVNVHHFCLHLWRPHAADVPMPPMVYV